MADERGEHSRHDGGELVRKRYRDEQCVVATADSPVVAPISLQRETSSGVDISCRSYTLAAVAATRSASD